MLFYLKKKARNADNSKRINEGRSTEWNGPIDQVVVRHAFSAWKEKRTFWSWTAIGGLIRRAQFMRAKYTFLATVCSTLPAVAIPSPLLSPLFLSLV